MKNESVLHKATNAAKWSSITQIATKLITPITSMILARLLAPEAFGVVATVTMIISFTDMFTDAGFQKYLVQHEFSNNEEQIQFTNVAFWTNLVISICLWIIIIVYREGIAEILGNPGMGNVVAIACVQLPLTSFSSIQLAIYRREFNFKGIFMVEMICGIIPLVITVPLALSGLSYWAIIIGNISGTLVRAVFLTIKSSWKPTRYYNMKQLKGMLSFSIWSLLETISVWLTTWVDALIIGGFLDTYYLGLYKNSLNMVNVLMGIVTASITPILFTTLSRLQDNEESFKTVFLQVQRFLSYLVLPMGAGLLIYKELATTIMFGSEWIEASKIIGIWAITSAIRIVTVSIYSEVYRAKGKPKICLILQLIDLMIIVPVCIIGIKKGFWSLVYLRALVRLDLIVPGLIVMNKVIGIKWNLILKNLAKPTICTVTMAILAILFEELSLNMIFQLLTIPICILVYIVSIRIFSKSDFISIINFIVNYRRK